jgi:hypothetical protein
MLHLFIWLLPMPELQLELRPSRQLLWISLVIYFGAIMILYLTPIPLGLLVLILLLATFNLKHIIKLHVLRNAPNAIKQIFSQGDNLWLLQNQQGKLLLGHLHGSSLITRYFFILIFTLKNQRNLSPVVICLDTLSKSQRRRLCVYLTALAASINS